MTSISKNVYVDNLVDTVNEYNNTSHRTTETSVNWCKTKHI